MFGVQKQMFNLLKSTKTTNGFFQNKTNCFSTTSISTSNLLRGFAKVAKTKKSKESKLILTNDVQSLGVKGEAVVVKKGFARNFLLPTKKAVPYNDQNRMEISPPSEAAISAMKREKEQKLIQKKIEKMLIRVKRAVLPDGSIHSKITPEVVSEKLWKQHHIEFFPGQLQVPSDITKTGEYVVQVKIQQATFPMRLKVEKL